MLLEEFIKPLGLSQTELAEWIGVSYPRLNEIVNGKRSITPDTALRLEQVFGVDAQVWLNLEVAWELYQAKHSKEARAIQRIRRHPALAAATG
jgi:addiction module HigA family antidote